MKKKVNLFEQLMKRSKLDVYFLASVIFCFLFVGPFHIFPLEPAVEIPEYIHEVWQIDEGLPYIYIKTIAQTRDGYIWLGTLEGIIRFDGIKFETFNKENTPAIKSNSILTLAEDREGSLWIGTESCGLLRFKAGKFTRCPSNLGVPEHRINVLYQGRDGSILIGTCGGGVIRWQDGKFSLLSPNRILKYSSVKSLYEDRQGVLWIGTMKKGLVRFKEGKFTIYNKTHGLAGNSVFSISEGPGGDLWIGTDTGLNRLKNGKFETFTVKDGLANNYVASIYKDISGVLWIGTYGGLNRFKDGKLIDYFSEEGIPGYNVFSICEDRERNLWIGMWGGGVVQLKPSKFKTFTTREGLPADTVSSIFRDCGGTLWLGTLDSGLIRWKNNKFKTYTVKDGLSSNFVLSIYEDRRGNLWIGTVGGGLNQFKDNKFTVYTTKDGLTSNYIISICESREGSLWIGTMRGLNRLKNGGITNYTTRDGLPGNFVRIIYEDRRGNIWIGTSAGGVSRVRGDREDSEVIFKTYNTKEVIGDKEIFGIYEDKEENLWLATFGAGLIRFKDEKFKAYTAKEGLFSNIIYHILEDEKENFWMSSDKGIFRVSKQELKDFDEGKGHSLRCISYGKADGMKNSKCSGGGQPAGWKTQDGKLWFPTLKGIVIIEPDKIRLNSVIPPVIVEKIKIDDRLMAPKQHIEISPGMRRLEFHYTAASFASPKKIKFKYKLEGFDKEWIDAGSSADRVAGYTNIPPGTYCFRVIACNNDGVWNEKGASFYFKLNPFFYQTSWFYGICIFGVLALGLVFHWLRVKQILIKERKKYEKARMPSEYADKYLEKLLQFMKDDKPYLDSEISLQGLSKRLSIPEHYLSQVINERLNRNFYNFINHYRLEEAKRILTDPRNHLTIIEVAFQVGFNSKSAFNRAFKQHTNMTPSDFKKKQKNLIEKKPKMAAKLEQRLNIVQ